MPPKGLTEPTLITQPQQLVALVQHLLGESIIAVDTESNSLHAYQEQVCLVQFTTSKGDFLVDPLVLLDLSPLGEVFASPRIEKVFHAAEYDLICLKRDFAFSFENLFDTMVAARILGRKAVGLGNLLEAEFEVRLDKRYQRADWGQRPLPSHLLDYARMDTHYLIELRHKMKAELQQHERWLLAAEDFHRLCSINDRQVSSDNEPNYSVNGSKDLSPQQQAVLLELGKYRDRIARLQDRPLFKVIGNKTLLEIAENCPNRIDELSKLHGMTPRQVKRHGKQLLLAVERGLKADPVQPRRAARPDEQLLTRLDLLRDWRKEMGKKLQVESDIVLPRDLMVEIAEHDPHCQEDLASVMQTAPWRFDQFGEQILNTLHKAQQVH